MNKIKVFALFIALLACMPSCHDEATSSGNDNDSLNNELTDSLATALAEKDSLMTLMNDINDGFAQIKQMQDIITTRDLSSETADRKAQLRNDMMLIIQSIEQKKARLSELEKKLKQSTSYSESMQRTITGLKAQLEAQQAIINQLKAELKAAHIEISNLNTRVDSLNTVNADQKRVNEAITQENAIITQEKQEAQEQATKATNELNTCYYAVGTKKQLKDNKIIETGFLRKTKIMEGDFEKSYFTKADKRALSKVNLRSKKAELMSKHPADSYTIEDGPDGKVLHITNPTKFWELSNFLVVKID